MKKIRILGLVLILIAPVWAETTLLEILKIYPDARSTALGGTGISTAAGPFSAYWNPALLSEETGKSLGLSYNQYVADVYLSHLGFVLPAKNMTFGLMVSYLGGAGIPQTDIDADGKIVYTNQNFNYYSQALGLAIARKFSIGSLGLEIKYLGENIAGDSLGAIAGSLGGKLAYGDLAVGLALKDVGLLISKAGEENGALPSRLGLGLSFRYLLGRNLYGCWSVDGEYLFTGKIVGHFGQDLVWKNLAFRLGINTKTLNSLGTLSGLSIGAGYNWRRFSLDYAFVPFGDLGNINRFTITYWF